MAFAGELPDSVTINVIPRISPSRFVGLKSCRLREVWASNRVPAFLPMNARARLGTIVHAVLAAAGRGEISTKAEIERNWAALVDKTEDEMRASWLDRSLVPLSKSVRTYEVDVLRTVSRASEIAETRRERGPSQTRRAKGIGFELWVHTDDQKVSGYIDHAYVDEDGLVVRDYKSGYIVESGEDGTPILKEDYVIQLQLYAALYSVTFADWPSRLELAPLYGDSMVVPFEADACTRLLKDAKALLDETNANVVALREKGVLPAMLASPSAETCRHCAYRPACPAYAQLDTSPDAGWPADISGVVEKVQPLMNGQVAVVLKTSKTVEVIRGLSRNERHPALTSAVPGDTLAVFNLQKSFPGTGWQEGPYTAMYRRSG